MCRPTVSVDGNDVSPVQGPARQFATPLQLPTRHQERAICMTVSNVDRSSLYRGTCRRNPQDSDQAQTYYNALNSNLLFVVHFRVFFSFRSLICPKQLSECICKTPDALLVRTSDRQKTALLHNFSFRNLTLSEILAMDSINVSIFTFQNLLPVAVSSPICNS